MLGRWQKDNTKVFRKMLRDESFIATKNEKEWAAWLSFKNVVENFLGNHKSENYRELVAMLKNYKRLGCLMNYQVHLVHSPIFVEMPVYKALLPVFSLSSLEGYGARPVRACALAHTEVFFYKECPIIVKKCSQVSDVIPADDEMTAN